MKLFAAVLFSLISFSAHAESVRLAQLTNLHNEHVAAISFLNVCAGGYVKNVQLKPFFQANTQIAVIALSEEVQSKKGASAEQAEKAILKRTEMQQAKWKKVFEEKGCSSPEATAAKSVFDQFGAMPPDQMMASTAKLGR